MGLTEEKLISSELARHDYETNVEADLIVKEIRELTREIHERTREIHARTVPGIEPQSNA